MEHKVAYSNDREIVCTCGEYFKKDEAIHNYPPVTAAAKFAAHLREVQTKCDITQPLFHDTKES